MFLAQWPSRSLALRGCHLRTEQATGPQCCLLTLPICNGRQTNSFLKLRSNPASRQRTYQADVGDTASREYIRWQGFLEEAMATPVINPRRIQLYIHGSRREQHLRDPMSPSFKNLNPRKVRLVKAKSFFSQCTV